MFPVMPELVHFWMQERQDEASQSRLARLASIQRRTATPARSLAVRLGLAADRPTEVCTCPEPC